jgi:hypothetical protein
MAVPASFKNERRDAPSKSLGASCGKVDPVFRTERCAASDKEHRAEKWSRFSAPNDAPLQTRSIGSIPKVDSTFGSDALAGL